jgi:SRSO17 transposase
MITTGYSERQSGRGRPGTRLRRNRKHRPLSVKALALRQPRSAWQTISWREGTAAPLASRFACLRVRPAHRDERLTEQRPEEWLLIEWPEGEKEPTKYWLSIEHACAISEGSIGFSGRAGREATTGRDAGSRQPIQPIQ